MEAGKYRAFQGRLNSRSEPRTKLVAKTPNPQVLARVSLLASHERLREKRLCLAGVQAIKSRFFAPIYRKYLYILSYPVFLYYAETPKVPPRVFGPLGPKTLRGQKQIERWFIVVCSCSYRQRVRVIALFPNIFFVLFLHVEQVRKSFKKESPTRISNAFA